MREAVRLAQYISVTRYCLILCRCLSANVNKLTNILYFILLS